MVHHPLCHLCDLQHVQLISKETIKTVTLKKFPHTLIYSSRAREIGANIILKLRHNNRITYNRIELDDHLHDLASVV